jgi:hypothetical protein
LVKAGGSAKVQGQRSEMRGKRHNQRLRSHPSDGCVHDRVLLTRAEHWVPGFRGYVRPDINAVLRLLFADQA